MSESKNTGVIKKFDLRKVSLLPEDILDDRAYDYKPNLFFDHNVYQRIRDSISNNKLTFIIGNPLSGKTRILYDALKNDKDSLILKLEPTNHIDRYELLANDDDLQRTIVIIDDIDDFCLDGTKALDKVLSYILKKDIRCVITCRRGPEHRRFRNYIHRHIFSEVQKFGIHIPRFDTYNNQLKTFLEDNKSEFNSSLSAFDGNMGSILLALDDMRNRFNNLVDEDRRNALAILRGLKVLFYTNNYIGKKRCYELDKVANFCKRYLKEQLTFSELDSAVLELSSDEENLNFVRLMGGVLEIEEAYLDNLEDLHGRPIGVVYKDYSAENINNLVNSLYSFEEKAAWGFPISTRDYNMLIKEAESLEAGKKLFEQIREPLKPDSFTFTALMDLTDNPLELISIFQNMKNSVRDESYLPLHAFLGRFEVFNQLLEALEIVAPDLLKRRNSSSNRLIGLAELNSKESVDYLFRTKSPKNVFNNVVYNQIVLLCSTKKQYESHVVPFIEYIAELDYKIRFNFIRIVLRHEEPNSKFSIRLIKKYLKGYDLENELGNYLQNSKPTIALKHYQTGYDLASKLEDKQKSLTNINRILLANSDFEENGTIVSKSLEFLISNREGLKAIRNTNYLQEFVIAHILFRSTIDDIDETFRRVLSSRELPNRLLGGAINLLPDSPISEEAEHIFNQWVEATREIENDE